MGAPDVVQFLHKILPEWFQYHEKSILPEVHTVDSFEAMQG